MSPPKNQREPRHENESDLEFVTVPPDAGRRAIRAGVNQAPPEELYEWTPDYQAWKKEHPEKAADAEAEPPEENEAHGGMTWKTGTEYAAVIEPGSDPLVVDKDGGSVIPAGSLIVMYGDGGAGKTTLALDMACHLAEGKPWQGLIHPARPLHIGLLENEGPRPEHRKTLREKFEAGWQTAGDALRVYEEPWQAFTFADQEQRDELVRYADREQLDLLIVGPLARIGMEGGGTLDDIARFLGLLADVQRRVERLLALLLIHHENRLGKISGAWEGTPDTLMHVRTATRGHTTLYWQKCRWSTLHLTTTKLLWGEGKSFDLDESPVVSNEAIGQGIEEYVLDHGGANWSAVEEAVEGDGGRQRKKRDQLIADGVLINHGKKRSDDKWSYKLWHRDDPSRPPDQEEL